jgi:hypothetical protein
VDVLRTDFESVFRSLKSRVNALGAQLQNAAPGAHEKRVEIQVRYLRNRFEVIKASLPFNLPTTLYGLLLCDLASAINALPSMVTGRKTSFKEDLKFQFGAVVIVASPEETVASGGPKGIVGIVVGKEPSVRGGMRIYLPLSQTLLVRKTAKPGSATSDFIALMNKRASESRQRDQVDRIVTLGGEVISPQPLVEDTIPDGMTSSLSAAAEFSEHQSSCYSKSSSSTTSSQSCCHCRSTAFSTCCECHSTASSASSPSAVGRSTTTASSSPSGDRSTVFGSIINCAGVYSSSLSCSSRTSPSSSSRCRVTSDRRSTGSDA